MTHVVQFKAQSAFRRPPLLFRRRNRSDSPSDFVPNWTSAESLVRPYLYYCKLTVALNHLACRAKKLPMPRPVVHEKNVHFAACSIFPVLEASKHGGRTFAALWPLVMVDRPTIVRDRLGPQARREAFMSPRRAGGMSRKDHATFLLGLCRPQL